jgi:hypothetical protein
MTKLPNVGFQKKEFADVPPIGCRKRNSVTSSSWVASW